MRYFLQVLTTGTESLSPSFLLFFDNTRFLFNCGEGMQRYFTQHKVRLTKMHTIFLTRLTWSHIGGLPGLILSAADAGSSGIEIIGPHGSTSFINSLYPFVRRSNFPLSIIDGSSTLQCDHELNEIPPIKYRRFYLFPRSSEIKFTVPKIDPKCMGMFKNHVSAGAKKTDQIKKICLRDFTPFHETSHQEEGDQSLQIISCTNSSLLGNIVTCYFIQCPEKPGKFSAKKADELNIFGPKRGLLTKGISVTLEDGREIRPSDVISPVEPGKQIFILELPSIEYIDHIKDSCTKTLFHDIEDEKHFFSEIDLMIYILGADIEAQVLFSSWIHSIPWKSSCKHLVFFSKNHDKPTLFPSSDLLCLFLREKCGTGFYSIPSSFSSDINDNISFSAIKALPLMRIFLEPVFQIHRQEPTSVMTRILSSCPISGNIQHLVYPAIAFLGTGSAIPSKYRNVSSILYQESSTCSILLDCGEDTLGQLSRLFADNLNQVLSSISIIFISHLHADHHLGLSGVLSAIYKLFPNKAVRVIAPYLLGNWISIYNGHFERLPDVQFIPSRHLIYSDGITIDGFRLTTVPMRHIPSSFGIIIESLGSKVSFGYSGDTRPCESFASIVKERRCSILIHEATFEDDLESEAIVKAHSTWSEAISMAKMAQVSYLIMVHFSQRYPIASPPAMATNSPLDSSDGVKVLHSIFDLLILPLAQLDFYYSEIQNKLLTDVEQEFTALKNSLGPDSELEEEIKFT